MPSVHPKSLLRVVYTVRADHLMQSSICGRILLILTRGFIFKVIRTAEIILESGSYYRSKILIPVHKKLDLAFAPPTSIVDLYTHISPDKMPLPFQPPHITIHAPSV